MASYAIRVMTANIEDAGVTGDVFIVLNGGLGSSSPINLDAPKDDFERGNIDVFYVDVEQKIGNINSVTFISSDAHGSWLPDSCIVSELDSEGNRKRSWLFFFPGDWFDNHGGSGTTLVAEPCHIGTD